MFIFLSFVKKMLFWEDCFFSLGLNYAMGNTGNDSLLLLPLNRKTFLILQNDLVDFNQTFPWSTKFPLTHFEIILNVTQNLW